MHEPEFGVYFTFRDPQGLAHGWTDVYERSFQLIEAAEALGYDGVWLSEHHMVDDGYSPSVLPIAAAVAGRTRRVKIGTSVLTVPFYHPVRLAEDVATVDVISGGRVVLGLSAGYRPEEFAAYGLDMSARATLVDESLDILLGCWTTDGFSYEGRHFRVENVSIRPKPVQRPHPPVYYGGKSGAGRRRAARVFDAMGGYPHPRLLWLVVVDNEERGWDEVGAAARYAHETYREWAESADGPAAAAAQWGDDPRRSFNVCSPAQAIALVEEYLARSEDPVEHLILGMDLPGLPERVVMRSMELFASEVMPAFRAGV